jgi:hypothetical protein
MPIEIKELHVRVTVNATPAAESSGRPAAAGAGGEGAGKDAIIAECLEQVGEMLKNRTER